MIDQEPTFAETIDGLEGETREIALLVFDQGEKALIEIYNEDGVLASEEFSEATAWLAIPLLMGMKRLREGANGTVPELARFMHHHAPGDASLLSRLAIDLDMPMDHLVMAAWQTRWPSADELRRTLAVLSKSYRKFLIDRANVAIKQGEIKDPALIELVESLRHKSRPQPEPQPREEETPKKKRRNPLRRRTPKE